MNSLPKTKETTDETWKMVQGFPMYDVSDKGNVRSYQTDRRSCFLKPILTNDGYFRVALYRDSEQHLKQVHRLVLEAFVSLRPEGLETNHKDGDKINNHLENLEWISHRGNICHAYAIGLRTQIGEKNNQAKLKNGELWLIKRLLWFELKQKKIAKMFKVGRVAITDIKRERSWRHIKFEPKGGRR